MNENIEKNMLRERAKALPEVTDEMFKSCNSHNVYLVEQYLETSNTLSSDTLKQYKSGLYQFTYYIKQNLNDKPFYKITKFDFKRYMSYLVGRNLSSSALKFKKSAVSAFCSKFLEMFIVETEEEYKTFRNFTTGVIDLPKNQVYKKVPITEEECKLMINTLIDDGSYMWASWVATMFYVGCRRAEAIQFKKEIVDYDAKGKTYVMSHTVRGKGRSTDGKPIEYMIPLNVIELIKLWLEHRDYDSEYIFTTKYDGHIKPISKGRANTFCQDVLSDILGRRVTVHNFKASCVTHLLEQGKSMKVVSKYVAHHESTETTSSFYDLRSDDDEKDGIFD